jgi:hypothetical protein
MNTSAIRTVVVFIFVVILSGWVGVLVDTAFPLPDGDSLGMGIWLILPLLTAIALTLFTKGDWKDLGFRPNIKGNIHWYLLAAVIFPVVTATVMLIGAATHWIDVSAFDLEPFLALFFGALLVNFIIDIFDGPALYGYLTAHLVKLNRNDWTIYLVVGCVWGLWHLPYYLVFLPESDIQAVLPVGRVTYFLVALITLICWSVMFIELYRVTQSVWPGIVVHMVEDALINPLVILGFVSIAQGAEILISPINGVITSALYLGVGLGIRAYRRQVPVSQWKGGLVNALRHFSLLKTK